MKANKTYQVQQHGRKTEYKTKKAALKLANELAIYNESDNVSVYEYNHNTGIYTEIYTREYNTTDTPETMNEANENKKMYTDYKTAVNWLHNSLVLCNNIVEVDPSVIDNARFAWYDEEEEQDTEIYQWFITDCSENDVEYLESRFPGLLFSYSDMLDVFVLCVDHFGTAWSGVSIETTLENAAKENI